MLGHNRIGRRGSIALALASAGLMGLGVGLAAGPKVAAEDQPERIAPILASSETILGEPIRYPTGAPAKIVAAVVDLAPGQQTGWHTHGVPTFGYILEGELTVDYGKHGVHVYRAGDALLEAVDVPHDGRNTGIGPLRILIVFMGADGLPTTVPQSAPAR
jgi:quercetin dioxygenase-like cupin family protein